MFEIERKFLTSTTIDEVLKTATSIKKMRIDQMYLRDTGIWVQRVREVFHYGLNTTEHFFTMKRRINERRAIENENSISKTFYESWRGLASPVLTKIRHDILVRGSRWHVDQFVQPVFNGLVLAEIELKDEDGTFLTPDWLAEEVTHLPKYKNFVMAWELAE